MSSIYSKISISNNNNAIVPQMYKGFSTLSSDSENYKLYDFALIKQDLINHFYIRQGEKVMNPTFGTIIWDLLFEPLTSELKELILQDVNRIINYDPRINAKEVIITQYESGIQIECTLTYLPYNISEKMKLQFDQGNMILMQ